MTSLKNTLDKLDKNLKTLQEREAKLGVKAPLDLLDQIHDHKIALALTRQALIGELSEAEWAEAVNSLLATLKQPLDEAIVIEEIQTSLGGVAVSGISHSQVTVGNIDARVSAGKDVVGRDKIITNIYEAPPPPLPPAEARERRNLGILLTKVKQFWIEGVLEKSVHNMALIDLGKETQAEAVAHAWDHVLELPDQSRQTLPPDKKVGHIFDEMNRALLILGEPGTGKTITLLQLAQDLIERAEQDEYFIEPVPVVFNLSTWHQGEPLLAWLVTELSTKYQIPKRIGQPWLEQNRLLPLLDGLDEVSPADRVACVEAINAFGQEFGLSGLAVCSRLAEYIALPVRLKLNGAIRLQPLSLEQVYDYLEAAGEQLTVLRTALEVDEGLQSLAQTPLILGIMVLAYQDLSVEGLVGQAHQSLEARRRHLFDSYIERMFRRKGQGDERYSADQTKKQLAWLGQQMRRHNQSIFLIEQLQPSWLVSRGWTWTYLLASRMITIFVVSLIIGLAFGVGGARLLRVTNTLIPGLGGWLTFGFFLGLVNGPLFALIDGLRYHGGRENAAIAAGPTHRQHGLNIIGISLVFGIASGLVSWLFTGPWLGLWLGVASGVGYGLSLGLHASRESASRDVFTVEALNWSWQRGLKSGLIGLAGGLIVGLIFGWIFAQNQALLESLLAGSIAELLGEQLFVIGVGLFYSLFGGVVAALFGGLHSQLFETKIRPNGGMRLTLKNARLAGPGFGLIIMLAGWLLFVPLFGFRNGLDVGLGWGLGIGVIAFMWYGGLAVIGHGALRLLLWFQGQIPLNIPHFLDYAAERIFLQKVGGGYIFIHRLLLEHFAAMGGEGTQIHADER